MKIIGFLAASTAVINPDGRVSVLVMNQSDQKISITLAERPGRGSQ